MHTYRTDPLTKNFLGQNVDSIKVEKYCPRTHYLLQPAIKQERERIGKILLLHKCLDLETLVPCL